MRFPILSLVLVVGVLASPRFLAGQGPRAPAGCYWFSNTSGLFFWSTYDQWTRTSSEHTSEIIEFTQTPVNRNGAFRLRAPGMRDTTAQRQFAESVWGRTTPDSVALTWGDGHAGLTLRLQIRGDSLVGTASPFSDMMRGVVQAEIRGDSIVFLGVIDEESEVHPADLPRPVAAHKVPCPTASPRGGAT